MQSDRNQGPFLWGENSDKDLPLRVQCDQTQKKKQGIHLQKFNKMKKERKKKPVAKLQHNQ